MGITAFINHIDQVSLLFIQTYLHFPILDQIMILATLLGDGGLIWTLTALILLINKKTRSIGIITLLALVISTVMGEGILKHMIDRPRPYDDFPWIQLLIDKSTKYSFPSGHTASSFAAAYVLSTYTKKYSLILYVVASTIALSRLHLFMHYPTDIIVGVLLGLASGRVAIILYGYIIDGKHFGDASLRMQKFSQNFLKKTSKRG